MVADRSKLQPARRSRASKATRRSGYQCRTGRAEYRLIGPRGWNPGCAVGEYHSGRPAAANHYGAFCSKRNSAQGLGPNGNGTRHNHVATLQNLQCTLTGATTDFVTKAGLWAGVCERPKPVNLPRNAQTPHTTSFGCASVQLSNLFKYCSVANCAAHKVLCVPRSCAAPELSTPGMRRKTW